MVAKKLVCSSEFYRSGEIEPRRNGFSDELKILMLSRKDSVKGHRFALDVHRILRDEGIKCKLIIAGVKNEEIRAKLHEGVEIIGWVSEEEKWKLLGEVDFVLSPSEFEGSSMTVIESIASGVPCICSMASAETIGIESLILDLSIQMNGQTKSLSCRTREHTEKLRIYSKVKKPDLTLRR